MVDMGEVVAPVTQPPLTEALFRLIDEDVRGRGGEECADEEVVRGYLVSFGDVAASLLALVAHGDLPLLRSRLAWFSENLERDALDWFHEMGKRRWPAARPGAARPGDPGSRG